MQEKNPPAWVSQSRKVTILVKHVAGRTYPHERPKRVQKTHQKQCDENGQKRQLQNSQYVKFERYGSKRVLPRKRHGQYSSGHFTKP